MFATLTRRLLSLAAAALLLPGLSAQTWNPDWVVRMPVGATLSSGIQGMVVDAAGVSYVTGITGTSGNTDIVTAAYTPAGALLWSHVFDGPALWHDQARGLTLGPGGVLYVTGNTPGPGRRANVLLLAYDAASGALLRTVQYSSGPLTAEYGASVATDRAGNVYVGGGTVGDGGDGLMLKFDAAGQLQWVQTWDGPAFGPYSQDQVLEVLVDPDDHPVALVYGVMGGNQPDYVVVEYAPADGATLWEATWGVRGGDYPEDMEIDAAGDVFVSGIGIDGGSNKYSTIKLRGSDGALLWQAYDSGGFHPAVRALALDGAGGVYIAGSVDPDGDRSNNDDDFYTVKRDAESGAHLWTHRYGAPCVGCLDLPGDLVVDAGGNVLLAGGTSSPPYATSAIVFVLDSTTGVEVDRSVVPVGVGSGFGVGVLALDATQDLLIGGQTSNPNTGAVEMTVAKYPPRAGVRSSGSGCPGSGASPLQAAANGLPHIPNPSFAVALQGGPNALLHAVALARGLAAVPIPFGAPGCTVQIDLATFAGAVPAPGANLPLPIPLILGLRGQRVVLQGLAVDGGTGLLVTSNALTVVPGL